jgi:hypothetical protein
MKISSGTLDDILKRRTLIADVSAPSLSRQLDTTSAYCAKYKGHCSLKITGVYPDDCIKIGCEHNTKEVYLPKCREAAQKY